MNIFQSLLPTIQSVHILGYWIAFFIALIETTIGIGLFIPGSSILLFMGTLAASRYIDLGDLILFSIMGAVIGDNINFYLGKKYGEHILKKGFWFINTSHFNKAKNIFNTYGNKSVFLGRFIPSIKEVVPLIAGTFNMKKTPFIIWNILGAIGWSMMWILPGYYFAQSLDLAKLWISRTGILLSILLIIFIILHIIKTIIIKKGKILQTHILSIYKKQQKKFLESLFYKDIEKNHKKLLVFIHKRLSKNNFFGLPFTLLMSSLIYIFALFAGIIEDIITSDIIITSDVRIANLFTIFRNPHITKFFFFITLLGKSKIILLFTLTTLIILFINRKKTYIIPLLVSLFGSGSFALLGKIIFHRARPEVAMYLEKTFSFPSGHATISIGFYGFLTYILYKHINAWKHKINLLFISTILILLIGISRLYLGVHYVSDVWGGYLIGSMWLIIAITISEYIFSIKNNNIKNQKQVSDINNKIISILLITTSFIGYIFYAHNYIPPKKNTLQKSQPIIIDVKTIQQKISPKFTKTIEGNNQEPLNIVIATKNDTSLIGLLTKANWKLADKINVTSLYKAIKAELFHLSYNTAPITPYFWNLNINDFGFQKETPSKKINSRHHVRFWKTNYITPDNKKIYVGTTSFDENLKWGVTHKISPDLDTERTYLVNDLQKVNTLPQNTIQFVSSTIGKNFLGDIFFTDGKLIFITN